MSCILQALVHNTGLRSFFVTGGHRLAHCHRGAANASAALAGGNGGGGGCGRCMACEFALLLSEYLVTPGALGAPGAAAADSGGGGGGATLAPGANGPLVPLAPLAPHRLLYSMWTISGDLAGYEQQDAHEFLIAFLDALHEHLAVADTGPALASASAAVAKSVSPPRATVGSDDDTPAGAVTGAGGPVPGGCHCGVHRVFGGTMQSSLTCLSCHQISRTREPFFDVSLHLPPRSLTHPNASFSLSEWCVLVFLYVCFDCLFVCLGFGDSPILPDAFWII
jgi:hypothetical protein